MKKKLSFIVSFGIIGIGLILLTSAGGQDRTTAAKETPMLITIFQGAGIPQPTGEKAIVPIAIKKALGVDVENICSASGNDYIQQLNTKLAAGDPPDIFGVSNREMLVDLVNKGIPLELTPYLPKMQDYVALAKGAIKKGYIGDKLYAFTNYMNMHPSISMFIRTDWLKKLNLQMPTNLDEFRNVLIAFTTKDPKGTGQKDTYGYGGYVGDAVFGGAFNDIAGAFGIPAPGDTFIKDGKAVNSLDDPAMPQFLAYLADLYKQGTIDPQSFSYTLMQCQKAGFQEKFGVMQQAFFEIRKQEYIDQFKAVNPNAEWTEIPAIKGPGGAYNNPRDVAGGGSIRCIPASLAKTNPKKLDKVIELINWLSGGEGLILVQFGLKDVHHTRDASGKVVAITDMLLKEGGYLNTWQMGGRPEEEYYKIRWPTMRYDLDFNYNAPRITIYNSLLTPPKGYIAAEANTFIQENLVAFITGNKPLSQYPAFLNTLKTTFKYQQYIDAAAQQMKQLGFVK